LKLAFGQSNAQRLMVIASSCRNRRLRAMLRVVEKLDDTTAVVSSPFHSLNIESAAARMADPPTAAWSSGMLWPTARGHLPAAIVSKVALSNQSPGAPTSDGQTCRPRAPHAHAAWSPGTSDTIAAARARKRSKQPAQPRGRRVHSDMVDPVRSIFGPSRVRRPRTSLCQGRPAS
jgi:hypothetical protein